MLRLQNPRAISKRFIGLIISLPALNTETVGKVDSIEVIEMFAVGEASHNDVSSDRVPVCLSVCLFVGRSVGLSVCLSGCVYVFMCVCMCVYACVGMSMYDCMCEYRYAYVYM